MKKILFVFGTRPEAIKLAPVILELKKQRRKLNVKICVTAQHRQLLDQVLRVFKIKADYDLNIMRKDQSLFDVTSHALHGLEGVLKKEKPDIIIVQGDTTTVFVAALAAYYLKIKVGHVEAGLRTKDKFNPFPEEINRRLADCLSDIYFAPTKQAYKNLTCEGIERGKIFVTGNTIIDALLIVSKKQRNKKIQRVFEQQFRADYGISFDGKKTILVTGHRRESFGKNFESICYGLKHIAEANKDVQIIYPVHLNPNVQKPVRRILTGIPNIHLIKPIDYASLVWLMNKSYFILTDSGGIQEEAPSLGKPVLVMRKKTERPEGIKSGAAKLVGPDGKKIYSEAMKLLCNRKAYQRMAKRVNPYGDGMASGRICKVLARYA